MYHLHVKAFGWLAPLTSVILVVSLVVLNRSRDLHTLLVTLVAIAAAGVIHPLLVSLALTGRWGPVAREYLRPAPNPPLQRTALRAAAEPPRR